MNCACNANSFLLVTRSLLLLFLLCPIVPPAQSQGAGHDRICVTGDTRRFAGRMLDCRYLEIEAAEHEILMERDVFRRQMWDEFDAFMARHI